MKCYLKCCFCLNEIDEDPIFNFGHTPNCKYCSVPNNLKFVSTFWGDDKKAKYGHIVIPTFQVITGAVCLSENLATNIDYHIRLDFEKQTTYIGVYIPGKEIMTLPGLLINPSNAREKLKLYLLFS